MKKMSFRKFGVVNIGEGMEIPVRTLSIGEEASIKFPLPDKLPMKLTALSENDKNILKEKDPNYKPEVYIATKVLDTSSKEYREYQDKIQKYAPILDVVKYIDFDAIIGDTNKKFYELLAEDGLKNHKDWFEVCRFFDESGLNDVQCEKILLFARSLSGHGISQKLWNLQKITEMDYYELIAGLEEVIDKKEQVREKALAEIEKLTEEKLSETFHKINGGKVESNE